MKETGAAHSRVEIIADALTLHLQPDSHVAGPYGVTVLQSVTSVT